MSEPQRWDINFVEALAIQKTEGNPITSIALQDLACSNEVLDEVLKFADKLMTEIVQFEWSKLPSECHLEATTLNSLVEKASASLQELTISKMKESSE